MMAVVSAVETELTLLSMLKLHRNKIVISSLTVLLVFLFGTNATYASHQKHDERISYRTELAQDLDGDHKPETATIRQCGYLYQVNIHFTTGRPKLRLTTYVTEGVAGLSFQTSDINNDNKGDLVIISATSIRPVAVWLNQGRAKFQKVTPWYYGEVGKYTGPTLRHRSVAQPEPVGNIFVDPLPQATPPVESISLAHDAIALLSSQSDLHPFDSMLRQTPPRGPPAEARV